ncbi:MAG TPA: flagellar hook-basal body protein [Chondromyces sp.]|nr:flagellar hook-basal body protein [Chondromyces sp.]
MFRGFYTAASGMIAQQRRTELLTNNMSNANTPGFKADQSSMRAFPEMLLNRIDPISIPTEKNVNMSLEPRIGGLNTGVYMQEAIPNFLQGDLRETGIRTDVALLDVDMPSNEETGQKGTVFYTVQSPNGEIRYTRNGNFTVNGEGYLATAGGLRVLDTQGQPIWVYTDEIDIDSEGRVRRGGELAGQIGIAYAENPNMLVKEGDGLFRLENGELPTAFEIDDIQFSIQQGFLERSNVNASRTMTDMLTAYRAFEANQKVLTAYDRSMEKAANEVGRLN